jgi:Zn-dependent peptidase ImmA (M78 family)
LKDAFDGQSMIRLLKFKERYGISLAAMVYRAEKQRVITKRMAKKLWMEFAKRGWKTTEPGDVRPDRATRFEELIDSAIADGRLTVRDAANIAAVRPEELRERIELASGVLSDDEPSILSLEGSKNA